MLEVKNLRKKFGYKEVLKGINLNVSKGEVIGIIGPSGCGKSTLLRSINYLDPPTSGQIIFNGTLIDAHKNLSRIRQKIGMVFQQFNLFDNLTVLENITLAPIKLKLMDEDMAIRRARELLKKINLIDKKDYYPSELSGGQKQRVAIARALIVRPLLMLFDEPTSSLDPEMIGDILDLMNEIREEGMTMIVVSHEMNFIKNFVTRLIFMDNGKIIEEGTPYEIFKNPKDERLKEFLSKVNNI